MVMRVIGDKGNKPFMNQNMFIQRQLIIYKINPISVQFRKSQRLATLILVLKNMEQHSCTIGFDLCIVETKSFEISIQ